MGGRVGAEGKGTEERWRHLEIGYIYFKTLRPSVIAHLHCQRDWT